MLENDRISFTPSCFLNRNALAEVNFYDEQFRDIEDYTLWLNLLRNNKRLFFMPIVTVYHRLHKENIFSIMDNYLIHPQYLARENLRKRYVYPFINRIHVLNFRFKYFISFFILYALRNKFSKINRFISDTLLIRINPFQWLIRIFKISII